MSPLARDVITLVDDDYLRVRLIEGDADEVVYTFTGVKHGMGGVQPDEFVRTASGKRRTAIFITDKTCSWSNAIDMDRLAALVTGVAAGRPGRAIGNSMGGYNAVAASNVLDVHVCIAISAQYAAAPHIIPEETRWSALQQAIKVFPRPDLSDQFNPKVRYVLLSGDHADEERHWRRMPDHSNILNLVFEGTDHTLGAQLRADGRLQRIFEDVDDADSDLFMRPELYSARRYRAHASSERDIW